MSSNTALFTSCERNSVTHSGTNAVTYSCSDSEPEVYVTYWILAQLLVRSHKPSLFGPVHKYLRVRHDYADEKRLAARSAREKSNFKLMAKVFSQCGS